MFKARAFRGEQMGKHGRRPAVAGIFAILGLVALGAAVATVWAEPAQQADTATRFAIIGDYGTAGRAEQDVANRVHTWNPDFILTTGDNNYPSGAASTIDQNIGQYYHDFIYPYNGRYGAGATVNKFFPAMGNHDGVTASGAPYRNYFGLPNNERYYSVTKGPVQIFVLDSGTGEESNLSATSEQGQWLRAGLAASTACWRIVTMHHPPYSSGVHGSNPALQWPYARWGATVVLAGHDHDYERIMDPTTHLPYIVDGIGGTSLYPTLFPISGSAVRYAGDYGAIRVDADSRTTLTFQTITRGNYLIDTYRVIGCTAPPRAAAQPNQRTAAPSR